METEIKKDYLTRMIDKNFILMQGLVKLHRHLLLEKEDEESADMAEQIIKDAIYQP